MMAENTKVRRGGRELEVRVEDLVKGDLVLLESGMRVPADCRIIETDSLKVRLVLVWPGSGPSSSHQQAADSCVLSCPRQVENSSFTGEPEPIEVCLEKTDDEALHSKNLAFNSAMIVEGRGLGLVVRTGDHTMIGQIAALVGQTESQKSTLEVEVVRFVHFIAGLAIVSACILYVVAGIQSKDWLSSFINVFIVVMVVRACVVDRAPRCSEERDSPLGADGWCWLVCMCVAGQRPRGSARHRDLVPDCRRQGESRPHDDHDDDYCRWFYGCGR
jgi:magnesium-transporting ATPase (P-type)